MWKFFYQLASPNFFYKFAGRLIPWLTFGTIVALCFGTIWGLFFSPLDYQQGDAYRIIYLHVPCAFLSMALYAWMGFLAILLLIWRIKMAGVILISSARVGLLMAFLALITGSIWGKPMWGTWWIWDARLTSELILFFLYAAIIAAAHAYSRQDQRDKVVAILTLVGVVDLPIIHGSVYWWNTLHQGATLSLFQRPKIAGSMLMPLLLTLLGFALYCLLSIVLKARTEILAREQRQQWVKNIILGES